MTNLILLLIVIAAGFFVYEGIATGWNWQKMVTAISALAAAVLAWFAGLLHLPGAGS